MATYTFHVRDYGSVYSSDLWYSAGGFYKSNRYDTSDELFVLYPIGLYGDETTAYINDYTLLAEPQLFKKTRINDGLTDSGSTTSFPQGDVNDSEANVVRLRNDDSISSVFVYLPDVASDETRWTSYGWSNPLTSRSTWKSEVCNYIAEGVELEIGNDVLADFTDWAVQLYRNHVIFYPGDDPDAYETIEVTV